MKQPVMALAAASALCAISAYSAGAQESALEWMFSNSGNEPRLVYGVPETDEVQASARCGGSMQPRSTEIIFASPFGTLENGAPARLRLSGGGSEIEAEGKVFIPQSGEGIYGVAITIPVDHAAWALMSAQDVVQAQVPGYVAAQFPLQKGRSAIQNFIAVCSNLGQQGGNASAGGTSSGGGLSQKEAFELARDLNSAEGWQAFLNTYQTGFFAELGRAYLAKLQNGGTSTAGGTTGNGTTAGGGTQTTQKPSQPLPLYQTVRGSTPWYNFNYEQDEGNARSYAAGVKANGVEFITWCGGNKRMNFVFRESDNRTFPQFGERVRQAVTQNPNFRFSLDNGQTFNFPVSHFEMNDEVGVDRDFSGNDAFLQGLMGGNNLAIFGGPIGVNLQLKRSRTAICNVVNRCGVVSRGCRKQTRPVAKKPKPNTAGRCRSRSTWVEGRGCVLKRHLNKTASGCSRGQVRFDGQCMRPSQKASYCGPGYQPRGNRCVSNADLQPNSGANWLIYPNGKRVTVADCERDPFNTPEQGYCVPDD